MKKTMLLAALLLMMLVYALPGAAEAASLRLDALPVVQLPFGKEQTQAQGGVVLTLRGEKLPYDASSNTYILPGSLREAGSIRIEAEPGFSYAIEMTAQRGEIPTPEDPVRIVVAGKKEEMRVLANICFTDMPVLRIDTQTRQLPGDEETDGVIRIFFVSGGQLRLDKSPIRINERGNTSRRFPKRSYRVHLVNDMGEKRAMSIAGLRSDDDWILNPMYTDTSKIREKLAYELWEDINSSGSRAASSRMEHVEVFFGEKYWGLYGVQERIDNKQVAGSKKADVLYKVTTNYRPTVEELLACEDRESCRAFEAQYGEKYRGSTRQMWTPAASYMSLLEGGEVIDGCAVDEANAIDYGLFVMLTQAFDCHFKNQFLNSVYTDSGYTMYKIPWDLNHTFGDVWRGEEPQANYSGYVLGNAVYDGYFKALLEQAQQETLDAVKARWAYLRASFVDAQQLTARAQAMFESIYPALLRDSERWPQSGMGEGNALNILDIESYFERAIPLIDGVIGEL